MPLHRPRFVRIRSAASHRLGARRSLIVVALTAVAAMSGLVALPATAAPLPVSNLTVVGGNSMITVAWKPVPSTTRYTVRYGSQSNLRGAKQLVTTGLAARIGGLTNGRNYYVAVTADRVGLAANSSTTLRGQGIARSNVPIPVTDVVARSGGLNQVVVTWSGGGPATKVSVQAGADSMTTIHYFHSAWYPATTHSITLTVPPSLRDVLGAGTGNVIFTKVVQSNSGTDARHLHFDLADKFRLSNSGTWALAGTGAASPPDEPRLAVATLNVQSQSASSTFSPVNQWPARVSRVAATIQASAPDVIGTQELDTTRTDPTCLYHLATGYCQEQYNTLATALQSGPIGYRLADSHANAFVRNQELRTNTTSVVDSELFYNPAKLTVVHAGFFSPTYDLHVAWPAAAGDDRGGSWAVFQMASGRQFLMATVHLPVGDAPVIQQLRKTEAGALAAWLAEKAKLPDGTSLPVVVVGDFNAYGALDANAGSLVFYRNGYLDAAATSNRTNIRWGTSNAGNGIGGDPGYPDTATIHPYPTSRIDYILVKGSPYTYQYSNVVNVSSSGQFVKALQGTDHNLQMATLGIAPPS